MAQEKGLGKIVWMGIWDGPGNLLDDCSSARQNKKALPPKWKAGPYSI